MKNEIKISKVSYEVTTNVNGGFTTWYKGDSELEAIKEFCEREIGFTKMLGKAHESFGDVREWYNEREDKTLTLALVQIWHK